MNFRLRYHLSFLPLFLGLAVAAIGLAYVFEQREIRWGLAQEAEGYAVTYAAFAGEAPTGDLKADQARRRVAAMRLSHAAGGLGVHWFEPLAAGWRDEVVFEEAGLQAPPAPDDGIRAAAAGDEATSRFRHRPDRDFDEVIGYAGVRNSDGTLRAVVAVVARDDVTHPELLTLWRKSAWFAAAALLASVLVAEVLTRRAQRDVAALTQGANALARGDYGYAWGSSVVRELAELAATLQAIARILQDSVRQTRRRFLRAEQLPGADELAANFQQLTQTQAPVNGAPQCALRRIGTGAHDDFWVSHQTAAGWHLVVGRLQPSDSGATPLERAVRADAAAHYFRGLLDETEPGASWRELHAVFPLVRGRSVTFAADGGILAIDVDGAARLASGGEGQAEFGVLGTLEAGSMRFARDYLSHSPPTDLDRAAVELAALLGDRDRGLVVVYRHSPSDR